MKRISLLTKLLIIYLVFTLVPVLAISYLSYTTNYNVLWKNTTHSTTQISEQIMLSISSLFTDLEYFTGIANEEAVKEYLMNQNNPENDYKNAKRILAIFDMYLNNMKFSKSINNIYLFGNDGKAISDSYGVGKVGSLQLSSVDKKAVLRVASGKIVTTGNINPHPKYSDDSFVYVGMPLTIRSLTEPFGSVIIELKSDTIDNLCNSVRIGKSGAFSVFNAEQKVIFGDDSLAESDISYMFEQTLNNDKGDFIEKVKGKDTLIVYGSVPQTDWKLVGHVAMDDLMSDAYLFRQTIFTAIAGIMICAIGLYLFFSNQLILPLRKLKATMKMAAMGDMKVSYQGNTGDEINDLGESFNAMIIELDRMAKQDLKRQSALQKMELDLLQAQINPHFLYNTLDSILWQAQVGNNREVIDTVDALASFFRTTLSKGSGWIKTREEENMIRNYLIIQKIRYGDMLSYNIKIEESIRDCLMLKLTLQPIVENAIYHGVKNRSEGGMIDINGEACGEYMVFTIKDDGPGMSPEDLQQITKKLDRYPSSIYDRTDGGFGLRNVNSRIKLNYGQDCGVEIFSVPDKGTTVKVTLRKEVEYV